VESGDEKSATLSDGEELERESDGGAGGEKKNRCWRRRERMDKMDEAEASWTSLLTG